MNKKELEELRYDVAVAMLKGMSPGSVFQFAVDRQLQLMELYEEDKLQQMLKQYSKYSKKDKKPKTSGGGMK